MKTFGFVSASVLALGIATGASAADLPRKSVAPVMAVPMFTWTGFYVGVNAGYAWGESRTRTGLGGSWAAEAPAFQAGWTALSNTKVSPGGFTGGLQAGYNWQFNSLVLGIEADINYLGLDKNAATTSSVPGVAGLVYNWNRGVETTWMASLRPRLGVAFDRTMVYVTGGLAVLGVEGNWSVLGSNGYAKAGSKDEARFGFTVGRHRARFHAELVCQA